MGRLPGDPAALPDAAKKAATTFERALQDPNSDVREAAAIALMRLHPTHSVPALIAALKDKEPLVSGRAASALAQIGKPAIPALVRALDDPDHEMRRGAAYALGRIGPAAKPASKRLQEMARSQDPLVRLVAIRALRRIDPQALPTAPAH
ncbi:MAG TPA: HEAT repeat domain-containing protein [Gemmataceae bacterium]|nr:HEAT repeat domain-containing protein [Gemmataceae bacterium]